MYSHKGFHALKEFQISNHLFELKEKLMGIKSIRVISKKMTVHILQTNSHT